MDAKSFSLSKNFEDMIALHKRLPTVFSLEDASLNKQSFKAFFQHEPIWGYRLFLVDLDKEEIYCECIQ